MIVPPTENEKKNKLFKDLILSRKMKFFKNQINNFIIPETRSDVVTKASPCLFTALHLYIPASEGEAAAISKQTYPKS